MRLKSLVAGLLVSSLVATPAMANSATSLSVAKAANVNATTSAEKGSQAKGVPTAAIIGGLAAVVGIVLAVSAGGSDKPDSK